MKLNTKTILSIIQILLIFSSDILLANAKIKLISRRNKSHFLSTRHKNQSWMRDKFKFYFKNCPQDQNFSFASFCIGLYYGISSNLQQMITEEVSEFISDKTGLDAENKKCMGYMDQIFKARVADHFTQSLENSEVTKELDKINSDLGNFKVDGLIEDFESFIRKSDDNPRQKCEIYSLMLDSAFNETLNKMVRKLEVFDKRVEALRENISNVDELITNYEKKATRFRWINVTPHQKLYNEILKNIYDFCMNQLTRIRSPNDINQKIAEIEKVQEEIHIKRYNIRKFLRSRKPQTLDCSKIDPGLISNPQCAELGLMKNVKIYWSILSDVVQRNEQKFQNVVPNVTSTTILTCAGTMIAAAALKKLIGTAIETILKSIGNIFTGGIFIVVGSLLWAAKLFKTLYKISKASDMIQKSELWGKAAGYIFQIIKSLLGMRKRRLIKKIR